MHANMRSCDDVNPVGPPARAVHGRVVAGSVLLPTARVRQSQDRARPDGTACGAARKAAAARAAATRRTMAAVIEHLGIGD
eukprot:7391742-Prymnesium_polylepis.2